MKVYLLFQVCEINLLTVWDACGHNQDMFSQVLLSTAGYTDAL